MASATESHVELRGMAPRYVVDVLDAISSHQRKNRWELVNEILTSYADDKMKEVTAILRVTGVSGFDKG